MAKKPTRLRFTEDDLADSQVKKAADRADKAADKAEKAVDKLASKKKATKLRQETDAAGSRKAKLRFGKADQQRDCGSSIFGKTACHPWHGCDTHIQGASGGIGV